MFVIVALPVQEIEAAPSPKNSSTWLVPPLTVSRPQSRRMTSLGEVHPESRPRSRTPMSFGASTSQARPAMTSPASAPPTPTASMPRPPPLGVCESVPIIRPPGKA